MRTPNTKLEPGLPCPKNTTQISMLTKPTQMIFLKKEIMRRTRGEIGLNIEYSTPSESLPVQKPEAVVQEESITKSGTVHHHHHTTIFSHRTTIMLTYLHHSPKIVRRYPRSGTNWRKGVTEANPSQCHIRISFNSLHCHRDTNC